MTLYGERDGAVRPVLQIAMPRLPRIYSRVKGSSLLLTLVECGTLLKVLKSWIEDTGSGLFCFHPEFTKLRSNLDSWQTFGKEAAE